MSYYWCHGPNCHKNKTQDRVRGSKGSKVLRTKKIKQHTDQSWYSQTAYIIISVVRIVSLISGIHTHNEWLHLHHGTSHLKHLLMTQKQLNTKHIMEDILLLK